METTEEFAARVMSTIDSASLAILLSIGHQTGLFDAMAGLPSSTSSQIADAAGLNERYVREWLGGMTVGQIVEYDPGAGTYTLPHERAALLTVRPAPTTWPGPPSSSPCWARSSRRLSVASARAAGCPTANTRDSTP